MGAPKSLCGKGFRKGRGRSWAQLGEIVTAGGHAGKGHRDFGCESHLSLDVTPVEVDAEWIAYDRLLHPLD